jgi:hypothetical protein
MRDVVLVHANGDCAASEIAGALGARLAMTCAVAPGEPVGVFGPRFRLVFLWSPAAEKLEAAFAAMAEGRTKTSLTLTTGAAIPAALRRLSAAASAQSAAIEAALRDLDAEQEEVFAAPARQDRLRKVCGVAATFAISVAGGALLSGVAPAHVAGLRAVIDATPSRPASMAPDLNVDMVMRGADAILENGRALTQSAKAQAQMDLVRGLAASEIKLSKVFSEEAVPLAAPAPAPASLRAVGSAKFDALPEIRVSLDSPRHFSYSAPFLASDTDLADIDGLRDRAS